MTSSQSATHHQSFQPMPRLDTPFTNSDGTVALAWYAWLRSIWIRTGCNAGEQPGSVQTASVVAQNPASQLNGYSLTGEDLGVIGTSTSPGGPAEVQTLGASPFVFTAGLAGSLLVSSGKVQISRDSGVTYYTVGLQGGLIPVLATDLVEVSWTGSVPSVVFLPGS